MTVTGAPTKVTSDPRGAIVGGIGFTPLTSDQYALILAAWAATPAKEVKVTYNAGPPVAVTCVETV